MLVQAKRCLSLVRRASARAIRALAPPAAGAAIRELTQNDARLFREIDRFTPDQIEKAFSHDPWLRNVAMNAWEFKTRQIRLGSYPIAVNLPVSDFCNARCIFCTAWLHPRRMMSYGEVEQFVPLIKHAKFLGLRGYGEPFLNPDLMDIAAAVTRHTDSRCTVSLFTNGLLLVDFLDLFRNGHVHSLNVSLNAATPETHDRVTGLGPRAFDRIINAVEELLEDRNRRSYSTWVEISLIVTSYTLQEVGAFVRLGNRLGVDQINLRALLPAQELPRGINYHLLPVSLHEERQALIEKAKREIDNSRVRVEASPECWDKPVLSAHLRERILHSPPQVIGPEEARRNRAIRAYYASKDHQDMSVSSAETLPSASAGESIDEVFGPDSDNPFDRRPPLWCAFPYDSVMLRDGNRLQVCCYMHRVPGFEKQEFPGDRSVKEFMNSPPLVELRQRLRDGPLYRECTLCPAPKVYDTGE